MHRVRIGIIGCGNVLSAYWPQAQQLWLDDRAEVVAACGRPAQRQIVEQLGVRRFATDYREVINAPDVELVLVLTSPSSHFEISRAALLAGKHVVSEKPMATTLEEAAELVQLARRAECRYIPAPFTLLSPTYQEIARRLRRGDIGKIAAARGRYGWSGPGWNEWSYRAGGGPLFDLACYNITSLTGWLGPAQRVMAMTGTAMPERTVHGRVLHSEVEDTVQLLIDFGDACYASIISGFTMQQYRCPALELYGTEGTLQMLGDDWDPDGFELWQNSAGCWQVFKEADVNWPWAAGLRHAVECIQQNSAPLVTPEHAHHVLEIMLAAKSSGHEGRAQLVQSRFEPIAFSEPAKAEPAHLIHDRTRSEFLGES